MLSKLAFRNAKRSMRDYIIYLFTLVVIVALMFAFHSMIFSESVKKLCKEAFVMGVMIGLATFFIALIVIWLISYMVRFMAEKRSKEFATYLLLGFQKKQIAKVFIKENLLIGIIAFFLGLIPGFFLQQLLNSIIYIIVGQEYKIHLEWNGWDLLLTVGVYLLSFFLALSRSKRRFRKMNIREMMNAERKNEQLSLSNRTGKQWMFFGALAYLIGFWYLVFSGYIFKIGWFAFLVGLGLVLAIYLFYIGLSSFFIRYIKNGSNSVWKKGNIFYLRQLASKIKTMQMTLGTLTILFVVALTGASCAVMLNQFQNTQAEEKWPFDIAIFDWDTNADFIDIKEYLEDKGVEVTDFHAYHIYEAQSNSINQALIKQENVVVEQYFEFDTFMKLSDYNILRKILGYEEIVLSKDSFVLHTEKNRKKWVLKAVGDKLELFDTNLTFAGVYTEGFEQSGHNGADYVVVVPDELAEQMNPYYSLGVFMTDKMPVTEEMYKQIRKMVHLPDYEGYSYQELLEIAEIANKIDKIEEFDEDQFLKEIVKERRGIGTNNIYATDDFVLIEEIEYPNMKFLLSTIIFPLFYIGLVFVCVALTILSVQQLSDARKQKLRYQTIRKLGATDREISCMIKKQLKFYYFCPFLMAIFVSMPFSGAVSLLYTTYADTTKPFFYYMLVPVLLLAVVYGIYYFITYIEFKRNVSDGK